MLPFAALKRLPAMSSSDASASDAQEASCTCFSTCHPADVQRIFAQLPVVRSELSPWYAYLRWIYGGSEGYSSVPLPVDMRLFGAIVLPFGEDATRLSMPFANRCAPNYELPRNVVPRCPHATCEPWFSHDRVANLRPWRAVKTQATGIKGAGLNLTGDVTWERAGEGGGTQVVTLSFSKKSARTRGLGQFPDNFAAGTSIHFFKAGLSAGGRKGAVAHNADPIVVMRWANGRAPDMSNHSFVEVMRHRSAMPEGIVYGCWYFFLSPPYSRGTGVMLNLGKTKSFKGKGPLVRECKALGFSRLAGYPPDLGPVPAALIRPPLRLPNGTLISQQDSLGAANDNYLALCIREMGLDTATLLSRRVLIDARPACTIPGQQELIGACPPAEIPLRTGWNGTESCSCDKERSAINCGNWHTPLRGVRHDWRRRVDRRPSSTGFVGGRRESRHWRGSGAGPEPRRRRPREAMTSSEPTER